MTEVNSNVAILKKTYQQWHDTKGGSVDEWMAIMDDDVQFMSLAQGAERAEFTKKSTSKTNLAAYFDGLTSQMEMIYYTIDEYIAENDTVVAIGSTSWKNKATGIVVETPKVDIVKFNDGKIIAFSEFYDTAGLIASYQA